MGADGLPGRLAGTLARGRAMAESRMQSRCTVRRDAGRVKLDGVERTNWQLQHTDLPCRLRSPQGSANTSNGTSSGGVTAERGQREWHVKHDTLNLQDNDVIRIDAGEQAGSFWQIRDASASGDQQTARRIQVIAIKQPRDWP